MSLLHLAHGKESLFKKLCLNAVKQSEERWDVAFYRVTRGRLTRACPLALLNGGAELVLRSECVRHAYRLLLSLKFLSRWEWSASYEAGRLLTGDALAACSRGLLLLWGVARCPDRSCLVCRWLYRHICRARASAEAGVKGSRSLICQGNFISHQGLIFESVTSQLGAVITGFARPDWKDSCLNGDDASDWVCYVKTLEQVCLHLIVEGTEILKPHKVAWSKTVVVFSDLVCTSFRSHTAESQEYPQGGLYHSREDFKKCSLLFFQCWTKKFCSPCSLLMPVHPDNCSSTWCEKVNQSSEVLVLWVCASLARYYTDRADWTLVKYTSSFFPSNSMCHSTARQGAVTRRFWWVREIRNGQKWLESEIKSTCQCCVPYLFHCWLDRKNSPVSMLVLTWGVGISVKIYWGALESCEITFLQRRQKLLERLRGC